MGGLRFWILLGGFDFARLVALLKRLRGGALAEVICEARLCAGFVYV